MSAQAWHFPENY